MFDKNKKALYKTFSWRGVASLDTLVISYFVTGSLELAGAIMVIEVITKMALYFLHEKLWDKF